MITNSLIVVFIVGYTMLVGAIGAAAGRHDILKRMGLTWDQYGDFMKYRSVWENRDEDVSRRSGDHPDGGCEDRGDKCPPTIPAG
jgi:hypothetical protein